MTEGEIMKNGERMKIEEKRMKMEQEILKEKDEDGGRQTR